MTNNAIIDLEYKLAEQELANSKLSEALYSQQRRIDQLEQRLNAVITLLQQRTDLADTEVPIDRPPHY